MKIKIYEPERLDEFLHKKRDKSEDFKVLVLKMVNRMGNIKGVSDITGIPEASIYEWIREWNNEKEASLENHRGEGGGRKPKLTLEQREKLKESLNGKEFWTTKEVKILMKERFGIDYSDDQIVRILREKMRMRFSKPFPVDYRRPEAAEAILENQLEFVFSLLKERGIKEEEIAIGFIDETRPQNTPNTVRVWSFGKVRSIKNTTKFNTNTIGFYAIKGKSVKEFLDNSKKESIASFLEAIKRANERYKAILTIIDNFPSHKSSIVKEKAKELGIYLVYLPPYSPDLNPIEYIWKSIKRELSLIFVKDLDNMRRVISELWNKFSKCLSYAKNWIKKFLNPHFRSYGGSVENFADMVKVLVANPIKPNMRSCNQLKPSTPGLNCLSCQIKRMLSKCLNFNRGHRPVCCHIIIWDGFFFKDNSSRYLRLCKGVTH